MPLEPQLSRSHLVISWIPTWLVMTILTGWQFTLAPSNWDRWSTPLIYSLILAPLFILIYILPLQWLLHRIGRWRKWSPSRVGVGFIVIGILVPAAILGNGFGLIPGTAVRRLESTTGTTFPPRATLHANLHGIGGQDRRHLWVIDGTPDEFEKMFSHPEWIPIDAEDDEYLLRWIEHFPRERVESYIGQLTTWADVRAWFPKHTNPPGPGYVMTNANRTRWVVWWDGI